MCCSRRTFWHLHMIVDWWLQEMVVVRWYSDDGNKQTSSCSGGNMLFHQTWSSSSENWLFFQSNSSLTFDRGLRALLQHGTLRFIVADRLPLISTCRLDDMTQERRPSPPRVVSTKLSTLWKLSRMPESASEYLPRTALSSQLRRRSLQSYLRISPVKRCTR